MTIERGFIIGAKVKPPNKWWEERGHKYAIIIAIITIGMGENHKDYPNQEAAKLQFEGKQPGEKIEIAYFPLQNLIKYTEETDGNL